MTQRCWAGLEIPAPSAFVAFSLHWCICEGQAGSIQCFRIPSNRLKSINAPEVNSLRCPYSCRSLHIGLSIVVDVGVIYIHIIFVQYDLIHRTGVRPTWIWRLSSSTNWLRSGKQWLIMLATSNLRLIHGAGSNSRK